MSDVVQELLSYAVLSYAVHSMEEYFNDNETELTQVLGLKSVRNIKDWVNADSTSA